MDRYGGPDHWHIVKDSRRLPCLIHGGDPEWKCFPPGRAFYGERIKSIYHDPDITEGLGQLAIDRWQDYWDQIQCRISPTPRPS